MSGPRLSVYLDRIEKNARTVVAACEEHGIHVFGVTKGACGMPQVAQAMIRGGVSGIGESRFRNIQRLRDSGIDCPVMLLRSPPLSRVEEVVHLVDISLHSELVIITELSRVAERMGRPQDIVLMVDLGDLREGIWPDDLLPMVEKVLDLPGVRIAGIGTNLTCFGAVLPTVENMTQLSDHAHRVEDRFGISLDLVTGGNSSSLPLMLSGDMPAGITNLRIGESILKGGHDTFHDEPWDALDQDTFRLSAELLEVKKKPSQPIGKIGVDAFGDKPVFEDRGERWRGILNIGREDVEEDGLTPLNPRIQVLGASSDHLILDLEECDPVPSVGDTVDFHLDYGALLAAMTSEYVEKIPVREKPQREPTRDILLMAEPPLMGVMTRQTLATRFESLDYIVSSQPLDQAPADGMEAGYRTVLLGSDSGVSLEGLRIAGESGEPFGLIWMNARAGYVPPERPGHQQHGVLFRALDPENSIDSVMPALSPENTVVVGVREVGEVEAEALKDSRITVFTIADIDALGVPEVMRQALRIATNGVDRLVVCYSPDTTELSGHRAGTGGVTTRETHLAMEIIARSHVPDMLIVNGLDAASDPRVEKEVSGFILSCFGKRIL